MSPSTPSPSSDAVVCVGESMILLVPESGSLESDERFVVSVAGAESNVACGLAHLGVPTRWVSRVGADPLGERMVRFVAERGVDATGVVRDPEHPTGVFFKDHADGRTRVFYYRRDSAAAQLTRADVARGAGESVATVHVSGVSLGVSPVLADTVRALIHDRPVTGARLSFDVNHRPGLWDAAEAAAPLLDTLRDVAASHQVTPAQVALAWTLRHPSVVAIPGASSVAQVESNVAAADLDLGTDELDALTAASDRYRPVTGLAALPHHLRRMRTGG